MEDRHATLRQRLISTVLNLPGATSQEQRKQLVEYADQPAAGTSAGHVDTLPSELHSYINKVALYAYKVTDQDIAALLDAGYSEDAIFEITVSTALGAGIMRLQQGLSALKGEQHAS